MLNAVGLPLEAIALIAGIVRNLDMIRTTGNVIGDNVVSLMIDWKEGKNKVIRFKSQPH